MKIKVILFSLLALPILFFAQTADDAYRFSQTHVTGSSRNQALGGAMGAMGVDVSNAATNPAGLGIATKGEFYFTPAFYNTNTDAKYLGNTESASRFKVGLNSLGLNLVSANYKRGDEYKRIGLSFSINNMARFNETRSLSGLNTGPAYVDLIVNRLNAGSFTTKFDAFKDDLFFKSGAFDTVPIKDTATLNAVGNYISNFGNGRAINQNIVENVSGYINSFDISLFGTPNSDKLYLGVSLGLPILRYQNNFTLIDEDKLPTKGLSYSFPLKSYEYNILTNTEGSGINLKLGVLYRATDFLRIGGYIHTPTAYTLSETYSSSLNTKLYNANQEYKNASPKDNYTYTVVTPFKAGLNLGFIIGKYAAIGLDYETVGYNQASLRESNSTNSSNINIYKNENNAIKQNLERTENIRAGLEVNLKPVKLRIGYNVLGTGITNNSGNSKYNQQVSGGLGFSEGKWYFDAAVTKSTFNYNYAAYQYASLAKLNKTAVTGSLTVGVRF
jgi:hypothetical protein